MANYKQGGMPNVVTREFRGINHLATGREGEFSACKNVSSDEYPCLSVSKGFEKVQTDLGNVMAIHSLSDGLTGVVDTGDGVFVFYKGQKYEYSAGGKRIEAGSYVHIYSMSGGLFIHEVTTRGTETMYKLMPEAPEEEDRKVKQCYIENAEFEAMLYNGSDIIHSGVSGRGTTGCAVLALSEESEFDVGDGPLIDESVPEFISRKTKYIVIGPEGQEDNFLIYREKESDFNDWCEENGESRKNVPAYMIGLNNDGFIAAKDFEVPFPSGTKSFADGKSYSKFRLVSFANRDKERLVSCRAEPKVWKEVKVIAEHIMPSVTPMEVYAGRLWCARLDGTSILASSTEGVGDDFFYFSGTAAASVYIDSNLPGKFTGVKSYNNSLIAFKEDSMTVIYGDTAANFSVGKEIRGVGCVDIDSAQVVDGILYFYSPSGFYAYGGGQPRRISEKLKVSFKKVKAFSAEGKYYAEGTDKDGSTMLLVYDTEKGIWFSEEVKGITGFCLDYGEVYIAASGEVLRRKRKTEEAEDQEWFFESMDITEGIFEKKGITEIYIKAKLKKDSTMTAKVLNEDKERGCGTLFGTGKIEVYRVPVKLKKGDSYKIRVSGYGDAIIYEMERRVYVGGRNIGEGEV